MNTFDGVKVEPYGPEEQKLVLQYICPDCKSKSLVREDTGKILAANCQLCGQVFLIAHKTLDLTQWQDLL